MRDIRPIAGANVWHGKDLAGSPRWQRRLSAAQLDAALRAVRSRGLSWEDATTEDLPLPGLAPLIADIRGELEDGCGLLMLRGIEVGRDVGRRYGELPGDGKAPAFLSSYSRTLSNQALRYHTDRCDVVGLFCIRQAMAGGLSKLCSSPAVHNAMLERRPDLAAALYEDVWRSRFGEERSPTSCRSGVCATASSPAATRAPLSRRRSAGPRCRGCRRRSGKRSTCCPTSPTSCRSR